VIPARPVPTTALPRRCPTVSSVRSCSARTGVLSDASAITQRPIKSVVTLSGSFLLLAWSHLRYSVLKLRDFSELSLVLQTTLQQMKVDKDEGIRWTTNVSQQFKWPPVSPRVYGPHVYMVYEILA
jgi:hypothetical protein